MTRLWKTRKSTIPTNSIVSTNLQSVGGMPCLNGLKLISITLRHSRVRASAPSRLKNGQVSPTWTNKDSRKCANLNTSQESTGHQVAMLLMSGLKKRPLLSEISKWRAFQSYRNCCWLLTKVNHLFCLQKSHLTIENMKLCSASHLREKLRDYKNCSEWCT